MSRHTRKRRAMRPALSMIELVFVIVVLGIVASLGAEMIAAAYKTYFLQYVTQRANMRTEIAAQQIVNLLSRRIPGTALSRNPADLTDTIEAREFTDANDTNHTLLEWIAEEQDSRTARLPSSSSTARPGWSGFCDVDASGAASVTTPGSDLNFAWSVMGNLYPGMTNAAIFFRSRNYSTTQTYNPKSCMGLTGSDTSCISSVEHNNSDPINVMRFDTVSAARPGKRIVEHYKLAASAYALCPKDNGDGTFDLILFYDYQPWEGERLTQTDCGDTNISHATLATDLTVFKFAEAGNTFRFKICTREKLGEGDHNITSCKERAIIR